MGYDTKLTAYHKKIELVVQLEADLSEARSGIIEAYKDVWPFPNCKTLKQFQEERLKRSLMAQIWRADAPSREKIALEESHARIRALTSKVEKKERKLEASKRRLQRREQECVDLHERLVQTCMKSDIALGRQQTAFDGCCDFLMHNMNGPATSSTQVPKGTWGIEGSLQELIKEQTSFLESCDTL